jgi:hypothetical protein
MNYNFIDFNDEMNVFSSDKNDNKKYIEKNEH